MKRILRIFLSFSISVVISCLTSVKVNAFTQKNSLENELWSISGADELDTSYIQDYLDEYGIEFDNANSIDNIGIKTVFDAIINIFFEKSQISLRLLATSIGVIFIAAALKNCGLNESFSFRSISVLVSAASLCPYFEDCINLTCEAIGEGCEFLKGFVPVFSSVMLFSSSPNLSGVYSSAMLSFCAVASLASAQILMPVLSCTLALSIVNSVSPMLRLNALIGGIRKTVITLLTFSMVIFVGLLSLQTMIASSADSLALKTSKYIVSSTIPIVGSAVGEAYSSVSAGIGVIRASTGVFGVICVAFITLPVIISAFAMYMSTRVASFVAELFGVDELKNLFADISSLLMISLAVLICFVVMSLICVAIVLNGVKG